MCDQSKLYFRSQIYVIPTHKKGHSMQKSLYFIYSSDESKLLVKIKVLVHNIVSRRDLVHSDDLTLRKY